MELYSTDKLWVLSDNFSSHPPSQSDVNKTMDATKWMVASYSMMFYVALFLLGALSAWFQTCVRICSSQVMLLVFLVGALMDFMSIFTNSHNLQLKIYFRLAAGLLIGIVFMMFGAVLFFSKQEEEGNRLPTLQKHQPSMGFVVAGITIPLIIVEYFLLASTWASKKNLDLPHEVRNAWPLIVSDKLVFLLQKIIQAIIYCSVLRYKTFRPHFIENAKFYLKVLAFFNFIEWIDSQVNEDRDVQLSGAKIVFKAWFDVFVIFYKALIIDYRLLCSLLFLEHALEEANSREVDLGGDVRRATARRMLTTEEEKHRNYGLMIGFISLSSPLLCALYYVPNLPMPAWVHVFSIAVNLTIIVFGAIFLRRNGFAGEASGLSGVKITLYTVTMPQEIRHILSYHLQVFAMTVMILATFLECLIDQYVGQMDNRLRNEIQDLSLKILFDAGPAMSLGFLIHLFLHFVIIASKTSEQPYQPEPQSSIRSYDVNECEQNGTIVNSHNWVSI
ncbi:uncharacterized protein LOC141876948 isoform X2 [Acropora palmata]|uniref:uncharacterized protein LOC141876948 isoform X2 n=1 Tax=Acropora palmata TaxID=6131 RepID=UPI003D9FE54C